ncbi:cytochrome c [Fodinibius sp. Rm-B-1B1-1]|uniref:c-type cytochrome n=1 Tax=Fodinibius alkaliphilus TaxID=3140241 RepID=UPI00315A32F6
MKLSEIYLSFTIVILLAFLTGCQIGDSSHMSASQQQQMATEFDEMHQSFETLMKTYQHDTTQIPQELRTLYPRIQAMHQKMSENHNHTMTNHRQTMDHDGEGQQMTRQSMHSRIQDRMTGEWYSQMISMHQQMEYEHQQRGNKEIAQQHRQQSKHLKQLLEIMPVPKQLEEKPVNQQGNPNMLNGANLYAQHCASCHGSNGQGFGNTFPPLVNSKWITGDKSIPVRIVRDGLTGDIEVNGTTYRGTMPAFKARLSLAEIAATINYLREQSTGDYLDITQEEIIQIFNSYNDRTDPWQPEELLGE